jgi:conjugal transfer pilus assembly protein TraE
MTSVRSYPAENRVDFRGELKTWIGDSAPYTEIKHYVLQFYRTTASAGWRALEK